METVRSKCEYFHLDDAERTEEGDKILGFLPLVRRVANQYDGMENLFGNLNLKTASGGVNRLNLLQSLALFQASDINLLPQKIYQHWKTLEEQGLVKMEIGISLSNYDSADEKFDAIDIRTGLYRWAPDTEYKPVSKTISDREVMLPVISCSMKHSTDVKVSVVAHALHTLTSEGVYATLEDIWNLSNEILGADNEIPKRHVYDALLKHLIPNQYAESVDSKYKAVNLTITHKGQRFVNEFVNPLFLLSQ